MVFVALMVLSMVIWGGSWVTGKFVAGTYSAETLTFWRFLLNTLALLPAVFFIKGPLRLGRAALGYLFLGAVCMGFYLYFFFQGLRFGLSGAAGVLVTTMIPLLTCVISLAILKRRVSNKSLLGLLLGIFGGTVLLGLWTDPGRVIVGGNLYLLAAAFLWAVLTICGDRVSDRVSPFYFSLLTNLIATVIFFFLAVPDERFLGVFNEGVPFWMSIFYLSVVSSAFATTVYFYASARLSSYNASSFVFIVPVSALVLSWIFMGETPKIATLMGGVMGITATYLINSR